MAPPKKPGVALSAIKKMQEQKRLAEEEERKLQEAEELRLAEEQRRLEEESKKKEDEKKKRQDAIKAEREELKKTGKYMTKTEREKLTKDRLKLEQMMRHQASGSQPPVGQISDSTATEEQSENLVDGKKPKKIVYASKRRPKREVNYRVSNDVDESLSEEVRKVTLASEVSKNEDSDEILSDWEKELVSDDDIKSEIDNKKKLEERPSNISSISREARNIPAKTKDVEDIASNSGSDLRSPICCVLGHVDTGKTKLLDKIRQTSVQEGEAGGITQQIGATWFPMDAIQQKTMELNADRHVDYKLPGLLIIDTPGHESFTNLRSRGSSLCNIAILVVDIMHGLEPQTIESINLLKMRKTPFVVALNKIDRMYGWKAHADKPFEWTMSKQSKTVQNEFSERLEKIKLAFSEQGLNAELYTKNPDFRKYVSLVPTSAITGEGIPDLLLLIIQLTQKLMSDNLRYLSELECTVLEVKVIEGLGTTIDVILSNGVLKEGDRIAICGLNGPIVTNIRALLTPQPLRELRVKSSYIHHKSVKAALGVKICAQDLDRALAGSRLMVIGPDDDEEDIRKEVMADLAAIIDSVDTAGTGVHVQASTIGSLEALLVFLKDSKIPVASINIGPVHKRDVMRTTVMLEKAKEYALMLCFDVKIDKEAQDLADELGIKIFKAEIIYHLFDQFTAYQKDLDEQKKKNLAQQVVFPCVLRIVPGAVFNKRDPIVLGVDVVEGVLRIGTPLCAPNQGRSSIGHVTSIEHNHKPLDKVRKGGPSVAIKIGHASHETPKLVGRHFQEKDDLVSILTRQSIDVLKSSFRDEMTIDDWNLVRKLKPVFDIQ
jgi:translation initiation factor 5B